MKMTRVNEGMLIKDKVQDKFFVITKLEDGVATATLSVDKDRTLDVETTVTITDDNAICFKIIDDPKWNAVPSLEGYAVNDGILTKDGKPVTKQGDIEVTAILGAASDAIVIDALKDGERMVFMYRLVNDIFSPIRLRLNGEITKLEVVKREPLVLYMESTKVETISLDDGEEVEKTTFVTAQLVEFKGRNAHVTECYAPLDRIATVKTGDTEQLVMYSSKDVDETGYLVDTSLCVLVNGSEMSMEDEKAEDVEVTYSPAYGDYVYVGNKTVKSSRLTIKNPLVATLKGQVLVDVTMLNEDEKVVTFADANYKVTKIKLKDTIDRGTLVELAD